MPFSGRAYVCYVDLLVKIRNDNGMPAILLERRLMDFVLRKTPFLQFSVMSLNERYRDRSWNSKCIWPTLVPIVGDPGGDPYCNRLLQRG